MKIETNTAIPVSMIFIESASTPCSATSETTSQQRSAVESERLIPPRRYVLRTNRSGVGGRSRQRGAVSIMTAFFLLFVLFGISAFAIDIARWYIVRNELQNAADAAALAGAACLNPNNACGNATASGPDFNTAAAMAASEVGLNAATNVTLKTGQVAVGGWDPSNPTSGLTAPPLTPSASQLPAVKVTISEADGVNNGPLHLVFGAFVGIDSLGVKASAVATGGYTAEGHTFPMAISQCLFTNLQSQLWDPTHNAPKLVTAADAGKTLSQQYPSVWGSNDQQIVQTLNTPYLIQINSSYSNDDNCYAGQWTPLDTGGSNGKSGNSGGANLIKGYVDGSTITPPVSLGSQLFIEDGTKASDFKDTDACSLNDGNGSCAYEMFPVINEQPISAGSTTPVVGFACLAIYAAQQGNSRAMKGIPNAPKGKYIVVSLVANSANKCPTGGVGISPENGAYGPTRLVQ
jgi:Flp pilus assembly protein TadG